MASREGALHKYKVERSKPFDPKDPLSEQFFLTTCQQANKFHVQLEEYNSFLEEGVKKVLPDEVVSRTRIYERHQHAMKHDKDICQSNVACLLPNGENLRTWLEVDQSSNISWQQPVVNKDQVSDEHISYEITIPPFNKKEFEEHLNQFNNAVNFTRQSLFNATPLAFSVQSVGIPRSEYKKLVKGANEGRKSRASVNFSFHHVNDFKDGDIVQFPTRLVIGCRNISLLFKFGLSELDCDDDDPNIRNFSFDYSTIPDEILDFFKLLPPLYSNDAVLQKNMVENILSDLYAIDGDSDIEFRCFDLLGLLFANGCRVTSIGRYTLSALCRGKPFPEYMDSFDEDWALDLNMTRIEFIQDIIQLYYDAYTILMGLLLRNIHPDPHIILNMTEMSQSSYISWFSEFIATSLEDCHVPGSCSGADTRVDLLVRVGNESKAPFKYLLDIIIDVPVASFGGARFLHHILYKSSTQYHALAKVRLPKYTGEAPNLNKDIEKEIYALRFKREYAHDSGEPTETLGLSASPSCCNSLYKLDIQTIHSLVVQPHGSNLVCRIKEWGRLNIEKIPLLFYKINNLATDVVAKSWLRRIDLYTYLSDLYFYMMGIRITVSALEQSLMIRKLNVGANYETSRQRAERACMKTEQRIDVLHHQSGRYGSHQKVHTIVPGDFTRENRVKADQKKRRTQRAYENKIRAGKPWLSCNQLKNEKRAEQLNAAGYPLGCNGGGQSGPSISKYAKNDLRLVLQNKN